MIQELETMIPKIIPAILEKDRWESLVVNKRKPYTYRAFTYFGDKRICLHRFEPCEPQECFLHPHPWPSAVLILDGEYIQRIGYSEDLNKDPKIFYDEILRSQSMYSILDPQTWHSVQPTKTTYTVMLNDTPWEKQHSKIRTTKDKGLEKMNDDDLAQHLGRFYRLLRLYQKGVSI